MAGPQFCAALANLPPGRHCTACLWRTVADRRQEAVPSLRDPFLGTAVKVAPIMSPPVRYPVRKRAGDAQSSSVGKTHLRSTAPIRCIRTKSNRDGRSATLSSE